MPVYHEAGPNLELDSEKLEKVFTVTTVGQTGDHEQLAGLIKMSRDGRQAPQAG